ncbi:hypothetical protein EZS27_004101 [termite gut metagenome]|uniref:Uncharacterized protein n=1 Tax=termite gut metagenome TaxID=433724 RepID=A0A5J4SSW7_9ZZZZ
MKAIRLHASTLQLPSKWEDLSFNDTLYTIGILHLLLKKEIPPEIARMQMLLRYTRYRPSLLLLLREAITKNREEREIIHFNLLRLSEQLTFAFEVKEQQIIPHLTFATNPLPCVVLNHKKDRGKKFELDITAKTDLTAREFIDCFDLMSLYNSIQTETDKQSCINQLCCILYPRLPDYKQNLVCGHHKHMQLLSPARKLCILYWFVGVVQFYATHPVYELLFKKHTGTDDDPDDKIHIGMNEIALFLRKEGYGSPDTMNLNDFFDAQIKSLKDFIATAMAAGVKIEQIAGKTGLSLSTIYKLS